MASQWVWDLPDHIAPPLVPPSNPMTIEKVELGRVVFYDFQLSMKGERSCGVCHEPAKGFTDGFARSVGENRDVLPHNSLSIANVAWRKTLMWRHPHLSSIEEQARIPLFQTNPVEMGMTNQILNERLQARDYYLEAFPAIFAEQKNPFSEENVLAALASYQRSIITVNAPYDLFLQDDQDLSPASQRGLALFKSEKLQCASCHGGPFFNQPTLPDGSLHETAGFFNTGMYNVDGMGGYPSGAQGLYEITKEASDKCPSWNWESTKRG